MKPSQIIIISLMAVVGFLVGLKLAGRTISPKFVPDHSACWEKIEEVEDEADFHRRRARSWRMECEKLEAKYGIVFDQEILSREEVGL